ncbi:hypothetical protein MRX96_009427 [Rhipicephalus microplus]
MDRRVDRKRRTKHRTKYAYGKRKRKPPVGKTKQSAAIESDEPSTASPPSYVSSEADTCSLPMLGSEAYDAGPSTSRDIAVRFECDRSLVSVAADDDVVPALWNDGESTAGSEAYDPGPSTSRGITVRCEREKSFVFAAADDDVVPAVQDVGDRLPQRKRTVQIHLEPRFLSSEGAEKQASSVRDALREVSATERKFGMPEESNDDNEDGEDTKECESLLVEVLERQGGRAEKLNFGTFQDVDRDVVASPDFSDSDTCRRRASS